MMSTPESHQVIAHVRNADGEAQFLAEHLTNVSAKAGLPQSGKLAGLLHDLGKYSQVFQTYTKSATGLLDQDQDEYVDSEALKGKMDHSTAGAQHVWQASKCFKGSPPYAQLLVLSRLTLRCSFRCLRRK